MPAKSDARVVWLNVLEQGFWTAVLAGVSAVPAGLIMTDAASEAFWVMVGTAAFGATLGWLTRIAQWRLTLIDAPWARTLAVK